MTIREENFALLTTWTCYGTWLPGDRRGYVSNTLLVDGGYERKQNIPGSPITADSRRTRERAATIQKQSTAILDHRHAFLAAHSIVQACGVRGWHIVRAAFMWNHVHVITTQCPDNGPNVRRVLKGVSQAMLCKEDGKSRRWWTAGGSDRYLHGERAILTAANYVANQPQPLAEIVNMKLIDPSERRGSSLPPSAR